MRSHTYTTAFFTLLVGMLVALPTHAATYTVDSTTDAVDNNIGNGVCETAAGECTLRAAVQEANEGGADTITIPAGTYTIALSGSEQVAATGDFDLTDSDKTTIVGAGSGSTIIDGADIDRVFDGRTGSVTDISGLTVQNGQTSSVVGGGIYLLSSTTTLDDVIVTNNGVSGTSFMSTSQGGGLWCNGGTLTVTDSTFSENGGATQYLYGGAAYIGSSCIATFERTTFNDNETLWWGGGVYILNTSSTKTFTDVTFTDNSAASAGAVRTVGSDGDEPIQFLNATFTGNTSSTAGGVAVIGSAADFTNATMYQNTASSYGGAIYVLDETDADVRIAFSNITRNTATSNDGGGIYMTDATPAGSMTLRGSVVAANTAGGSGDDCEDNGGITAFDYSYLGDEDDCTSAYGGGTGNVSPTNGDSVFFTAGVTDMGGEVHLQAAGIVSVTIDGVPEAQCLDAQGSALTQDGRGLTRPENDDCDIGVWESDQTDPVVAVTSGTDTVECSEDTWADAGATATDNFSTGLSASLSSGAVTEETVGEYVLTYSSSSDNDGNTGTNTRTVTVQDTTAPSVTVTGEESVSLEEGGSYTDAGATATDLCDATVTVDSDGTVDTATPGTYTITYSSTDDEGNTGQATRTVTVTEAEETPEEAPDEDTPIEDDEEVGDGEVTVNTNGKRLRVYVDGALVTSKKIGKNTLKKRFRKIRRGKLYKKKAYQTVAVVTARKRYAYLTVYRLTPKNKLTTRARKKFRLGQRSYVRVTFNTSKKRIVVKVGKNARQHKRMVYKLTKKGKLRAL